MSKSSDKRATNRALERGSEAQKDAVSLADRGLDFQLEQYQEWKNVFGDLQKNLGEYFKNLTPEDITSRGLQRQQIQHQQAVETIRKNLSKRGLSESKFEDYTLAMAELQNEYQKANIREGAEQQVLGQKMGFLQAGLGTGISHRQGVSGAISQGIQSRGGLAHTELNRANIHHNRFRAERAFQYDLAKEGLSLAGYAGGAFLGPSTLPLNTPKTPTTNR